MIDPTTSAVRRSHASRCCAKLALMPTGTADAGNAARCRPSARSPATPRNHFARFVILDEAGLQRPRCQRDALIDMARGVNPLDAAAGRPAAHCPYLLFAADFDARATAMPRCAPTPTNCGTTMRSELSDRSSAIASASTSSRRPPTAFAAYIRRCQIETTMPFNDYWPDGSAS